MSFHTSRVVLFPADLLCFSGGCARGSYRLYNKIRLKFKLEKSVRITIFHVRDYYQITIEDVLQAIFGKGN